MKQGVRGCRSPILLLTWLRRAPLLSSDLFFGKDLILVRVTTTSKFRLRKRRAGGVHPLPRNARCAVLLLVLSIIAGCNRGGLHLVPVDGVVTLDGKPVADAGVLFSPADPKMGPPASGTTDADGKFTLATNNRSGAAVGDHAVVIAREEVKVIPQSRGFPIYETKHIIPPKYGEMKTSGLSATVKENDNHFEFKLTTK